MSNVTAYFALATNLKVVGRTCRLSKSGKTTTNPYDYLLSCDREKAQAAADAYLAAGKGRSAEVRSVVANADWVGTA